MHQVSRAANSITVSWPQPEQTNGNILDYQLRYYDQVGRESGASAGLTRALSPHNPNPTRALLQSGARGSAESAPGGTRDVTGEDRQKKQGQSE